MAVYTRAVRPTRMLRRPQDLPECLFTERRDPELRQGVPQRVFPLLVDGQNQPRRGADYLSPALVQEIFHDALRHRVGLTYEAEAEGLSTDKVLDQVLIRTPVPAKV